LVSRTGVTGERDALSGQLEPLVQRLRRVTTLPLAVGFGIARPNQAAAAARLADGVVVGSAFVRLIEESEGCPDLERRLEEFARQLKQAMAG
jgi:tryptophan synthase alpha chain